MPLEQNSTISRASSEDQMIQLMLQDPNPFSAETFDAAVFHGAIMCVKPYIGTSAQTLLPILAALPKPDPYFANCL